MSSRDYAKEVRVKFKKVEVYDEIEKGLRYMPDKVLKEFKGNMKVKKEINRREEGGKDGG